MRTALLLSLLTAPLARALAQEPAPMVGVDTGDPIIAQVRQRIKEEPAFARMVAERVERSRLAADVAGGKEDRLKTVSDWVKSDPDAAARLAVGLAQDDAAGNTSFEDAVLRQGRMSVVDNTKDHKGVLGSLRNAASKSKLIKTQEDLSPDERRELMRTLFEGHGGMSGRVLNGMPPATGAQGGPAGGGTGNAGAPVGEAPPETAFAGYYDRLSAGNLRGYSPQLLALQSALNRRRPPGAPALIETGKLDYATLSYPGYGMDYDAGNLESRARRDRLVALARLAGVEIAARDLQDPDLESKLAAKIPADKLPPRLKRRAELAAKARAAVTAFQAAALASKDPERITKGLLVELGARQREAARWITAAALEEELARVDGLDGFLTPELTAAIDAAPAAPETRAAYKARGQEIAARVGEAKADAQKAQDLLSADSWQSAVAEVDRLSTAERALRAALARGIPTYSRVPVRLAETGASASRWRQRLDDLMVAWLPGSDYARGVASRRERRERYLALFTRIAGGDLDGSAAALAGLEPAPR